MEAALLVKTIRESMQFTNQAIMSSFSNFELPSDPELVFIQEQIKI